MSAMMQLAWGTPRTPVTSVAPTRTPSCRAAGVPGVRRHGRPGGGDVASAIVVDEFRGRVGADAVEADWVAGLSPERRGGFAAAGGGATVTGAALVEHSGAAYWLAFNIGDSRIYRCADGALTQISVDHSYVQELVDAGELGTGRRPTSPAPQRDHQGRRGGGSGRAGLLAAPRHRG